jgi:CRP-like cAMP-binding protein
MEWPLFAEVPDAEFREMLVAARRRTFGRGEVVFHQDDPADSLHLVVAGRFAVRVATRVGDIATLGICSPGEVFGEMALVDDDAKRSATVVALEDSETRCVFHADFARLRQKHPSIDRVLVALLAEDVRALTDRLTEALFLPVEKRVRRRLVELARIYPSDGEGVLIPLTQEVVAELAGARRATVNQVLRQEAERGTIQLSRGKLRVLDIERLATRI